MNQLGCRMFQHLIMTTVFPHIVSSLEYFSPLNSFPTLVRKLLHRRKTNGETIWIFQGFTISKKNSCRGNYMRKCGISLLIWLLNFILYIASLNMCIADCCRLCLAAFKVIKIGSRYGGHYQKLSIDIFLQSYSP